MKSDLPKVLFPVLGRPMIHWVLDALETAGVARTIVVVGYRADDVRRELANRQNIEFALQSEQNGTGHAVQMCRPLLEQHQGPVLIVAGDSPMIQHQSVRELLENFAEKPYSCLLGTLEKENPTGLGRIVRDSHGAFAGIVEHKDCTPSQLEIREVNMSTYLFDNEALLDGLSRLQNNNAQGEFYLTDCPGILLGDGKLVDAVRVLRPCESLSINTVEELQAVEAKMQEMGYSSSR